MPPCMFLKLSLMKPKVRFFFLRPARCLINDLGRAHRDLGRFRLDHFLHFQEAHEVEDELNDVRGLAELLDLVEVVGLDACAASRSRDCLRSLMSRAWTLMRPRRRRHGDHVMRPHRILWPPSATASSAKKKPQDAARRTVRRSLGLFHERHRLGEVLFRVGLSSNAIYALPRPSQPLLDVIDNVRLLLRRHRRLLDLPSIFVVSRSLFGA